MTIIQAQPLKQFGISGPASALDNEVPIFDGITGKKIKAATGITSPSSGRLKMSSTAPYLTLHNTVHEDTDYGRESEIIFKGEQSGGEETTLGIIQVAHDGTADDQKGIMSFKVNDGNDGNAPGTAMTILANGNVGIGTENPFYSLDVDELGNSAGNLKLQADVQGDVTLFEDTDVGDAVDGKSLTIYRKAAEGDCYFDFKIKNNKVGQWYLDGLSAFEFKGGRFDFVNHIRFGTNYGTDNYSIYHYGYLTDVAANKYIRWQVNDATDNFELSRQDSNIGYFDIQMPTIITGGNVGIGTTAPSAKLDINSDIIRLRTAKTPASAGAAGNQGDECWDADYHYRCVATNTWKRTALTTW